VWGEPENEDRNAEAYAGAVDHYLSPSRHDAVKTMWEEPATRRMLTHALSRIETKGGFQVLDIGCGTGDGLSLLLSTPACQRWGRGATAFRYVGLDLDPELLAAGRRMFTHLNAHFVRGDMRDRVPAGNYDLYLSCGVPYSHLTPEELEQTLKNLFSAARTSRRPSAVVVDVLGRYSIEWTSRWDNRRWPYRMSFFATDRSVARTNMTFYSGAELRALVERAAAGASCPLRGVDTYDRSIAVGRHTTTGEFNPDLPPYRTLVNGLANPNVTVDWESLFFNVSIPNAPRPVTEFFDGFSRAWNELVLAMRRSSEMVNDSSLVMKVMQPMLASGLERLEATKQRGLGVGHSLTAIAYTDPSVDHCGEC
jgi:SAM-dependent methyltransferase